jgi:predicted short-subunit dehydrogenase-like oxidoreductase (DUF2520 family)
MAKPVLSLIGAGRLGSSLTAALAGKGYQVYGVCDRDLKTAQETAKALSAPVALDDPSAVCPGADVIILSVPDAQIKPVSEQLAAKGTLKKGQIICHTSGFLPSSVLVAVKFSGVYAVSMHPMMSFTRRLSDAGVFRGVTFALEGDAIALETARELATALDAFVVVIKPQDKPLYHAAAVMSSNYLITLLAQSVALLHKAGIGPAEARQMLLPMATSIIEGLKNEELAEALTGPIERGDAITVEGHIRALKNAQTSQLEVYKALGRATLEMVRGKLPTDQVQALEWTLDK